MVSRCFESSGRTRRGEAECLWIPMPALKKQEKSTLVLPSGFSTELESWGERGEEEEERMNGEDNVS